MSASSKYVYIEYEAGSNVMEAGIISAHVTGCTSTAYAIVVDEAEMVRR